MAVAFAYLPSFSMAFLLLVVQPMATKVILPQFGGTPAVWMDDYTNILPYLSGMR